METRNILLIGSTGGGKSTLANVITGTDNFKESESSISVTKHPQVEEVTINGITYRIVDTIGIGDTALNAREVLYKIADATAKVKEGVHQVLFVINGRFTQEEKNAYDILRTVIFDENIIKYTTIVRTHFPNFDDPNKCLQDKNDIIDEGGPMSWVVQKCNKMIHVDNPPVDVGRERLRLANEETRTESREVLMNHLNDYRNVFKPASLDELNARIWGHMTKEEEIEYRLLESLLEQEESLNSETVRKSERELEKAEKRVRESFEISLRNAGYAVADAITFIPRLAAEFITGGNNLGYLSEEQKLAKEQRDRAQSSLYSQRNSGQERIRAAKEKIEEFKAKITITRQRFIDIKEKVISETSSAVQQKNPGLYKNINKY